MSSESQLDIFLDAPADIAERSAVKPEPLWLDGPRAKDVYAYMRAAAMWCRRCMQEGWANKMHVGDTRAKIDTARRRASGVYLPDSWREWIDACRDAFDELAERGFQLEQMLDAMIDSMKSPMGFAATSRAASNIAGRRRYSERRRE